MVCGRRRSRWRCGIGCARLGAEARAAADRLVATGELLVLRCRQSGERADWSADAWDAVAAQLGAALGCSVAMGHPSRRCAVCISGSGRPPHPAPVVVRMVRATSSGSSNMGTCPTLGSVVNDA